MAQAIPYWQQAGQRALQRSANVEAIAHLTRGLAVLTTLPETPEHAPAGAGPAGRARSGVDGGQGAGRSRRGTRLRPCPGAVSAARRHPAALSGAAGVGAVLSDAGTGAGVAPSSESSCSAWPRPKPDPAPRLLAHFMLGQVVFYRGEPAMAQTHHAQALALYDPQAAPGPGDALRPGPRRGRCTAGWPGRCGTWAAPDAGPAAQPGGTHPGAGGGAPL